MISFWEKIAFTKYDLIVVGGGITGLFSALSFNKKHPNSRIAILDRGIFPNGASTKNAGFACLSTVSKQNEKPLPLPGTVAFPQIAPVLVTGIQLESFLFLTVSDISQWDIDIPRKTSTAHGMSKGRSHNSVSSF